MVRLEWKVRNVRMYFYVITVTASSSLRFPGQARVINLCNNLIPRLPAAAENIKIDKLVTVIVQDAEQFGTPDRKLEAVKASLRPGEI